MGIHSRRTKTVVRTAAAASAIAAGATATLAGTAAAAPVVIPNTDISVDVQGVENIPNIANVPGASDWIPSLEGQAQPANYNAVVQAAAPVAAAPAPSTGQAIVDAARSKMGAPYVSGAAGPSAFDCSGLTSWAYSQVGKSIPRTSYAQAAQGQQVSLDALQPGDIVVYYSGASHVGIYSGNGMVVQALNEGTPLSEQPLHYMPIHSAVRF